MQDILNNITPEDLKELKDELFIYNFFQSIGTTRKRNIKAIERILNKYGVRYINDIL